jgi:NAD(P)-dependent dehydrogenase (short-subunit alcohol dehydrogenase family)
VHVFVTLTRGLLTTARAALRDDPGAVLRMPAGVRCDGDQLEILLPTGEGQRVDVRIFRPPAALRYVSHHYWEAFERRVYPRPTLDLALAEEHGGSAALLFGGEVWPLAEVRVAGARMERWIPGVPEGVPEAREPAEDPLEQRFSRYRGALGSSGALDRLQRLTAAVVGLGRLGSGLATDLARAGVSVVLIDGDRFESHGLEAMEADPEWLGRPKVEAVAAHLRRVAPGASVTPIAAPIEDPRAFAACAAADLVVSAPDDNRARLCAALAAAGYLRPHLDLGSGVFEQPMSGWTAGADVRLMLPGEGCLVCAGGLDLERPREPDWRRERAGSLRSLNHLAIGQGMALLERMVVGDLRRSTWMRLVLERDGSLGSEVMPWTAREGCRVCGVTGWGDGVLGRGKGDG